MHEQSLDLHKSIEAIRKRQGLKQSAIADRLGLHPSVPSLWENGKRDVPAERVEALANALEVSVEELLAGATLTPPPLPPEPVPPPPVAVDDAAGPDETAEITWPAEPVAWPVESPQPYRSQVDLLWCTSTHGARFADGTPALQRLHHHGIRPVWGPLYDSAADPWGLLGKR
jgi:transcriptional regulator with XRE-family HTH domain